MTFTTPLSTYALIALTALLLPSLYIIILYRRYILRPMKTKHPVNEEEIVFPPVTIAVYTGDSANGLRELIPALLEQDYPAERDIVIINDGENEDVKEVFNYFSHRNPSLYMTFVPKNAKNLSRRKMAVTLGVKAARQDIIIFTEADSMPASDKWIREMATPFTQGKEIVLGRTCYNTDDFSKATGVFSRFFRLMTTMDWLAAATGGHPYRGEKSNIAFTKELFNRNKGFASSLNLHGGTDDIFVSETATPENCGLVLAPDAAVTEKIGTDIAKEWRHSRTSHIFTSSKLYKGSRRMLMSGSLALWLMIAASVAGFYPFLTATVNGIYVSVMTALWIAVLIFSALTFGKISKWCYIKLPVFLTPLLLLLYPFSRFIWRMKSRAAREYEYTWM